LRTLVTDWGFLRSDYNVKEKYSSWLKFLF